MSRPRTRKMTHQLNVGLFSGGQSITSRVLDRIEEERENRRVAKLSQKRPRVTLARVSIQDADDIET